MDYVAAILLFGAAAVGLFPLVHISKGMMAPRLLVMVHAALAAAGFLSLVVYTLVTEKHHKHYETLVMLGLAGLLGLLVWIGKVPEAGKRGWLIAYSLLGMTGLWWLLTFLIKT